MRRVYGIFWLPIARPHGIFPRQDRGFGDFRGLPGMELGLGFFRVAKILSEWPGRNTRCSLQARHPDLAQDPSLRSEIAPSCQNALSYSLYIQKSKVE